MSLIRLGRIGEVVRYCQLPTRSRPWPRLKGVTLLLTGQPGQAQSRSADEVARRSITQAWSRQETPRS